MDQKEATKMSVREQALSARSAGRALTNLSNEERQKILHAVADTLIKKEKDILAANQIDIEAAKTMKMKDAMCARLVLSSKKIATLADGLRGIANQNDPIGKIVRQTQIATGLLLQQTTVPIGVLMIIFESRPDCLPQIAALAIRSGNGLILKGGKEAMHTNRLLHAIITQTITDATHGKIQGSSLVGMVEGRDEIAELLKLDDVIDLVIPRGSGELVSYIKANTRIPVMGHAEGICHTYVDSMADLEKAIRIVIDAKTDYPAACNAMETLLLHTSLVADKRGEKILYSLAKAGVSLFGGPVAAEVFNLKPVISFKTEYGALACSVEVVESMEAAIDHIHKYGSSHTEVIVTEDKKTAEDFCQKVDASCVFHNVSSRFADGYRFGLGAEVGISTGRIHARGPVGVDGLTTTKWKMVSDTSDTAAEYASGFKTFLHKAL